MVKTGRRAFFKNGILGVVGAGAVAARAAWGGSEAASEAAAAPGTPPAFKLGLVTYNLAKDWDVETLITNCEATGFEAVELRTTHRHGVEISLDRAQRADVRKRFAGSRVRLLSLGTTCEYHAADAVVVRSNIEETHRWCELARDLGCLGVKVRPNGFPPGVPEEKTLEQIGKALVECGREAQSQGVEIWAEVHGKGTQLPKNMHRIMELANHPAVGVCWNSNDQDVMDGSVKAAFDLLGPRMRNVHINEIWRTLSPWKTPSGLFRQAPTPGFPDWQMPYPWRELFSLLRAAGYNRYTLAEIPESADPIRLMRYYRALWEYHAA